MQNKCYEKELTALPPKPKFTKEEIVQAALALVSEKGMEALTARDLGARLGSSARPVFTVFQSMEEVQCAVCEAAMERLHESIASAPADLPPFKRVGMGMVTFAVRQPKLYQLLFMTENDAVSGFDGLFDRMGFMAVDSMHLLMEQYGLTEPVARTVFEQTWICTFGIGALCATRAAAFSEEEMSHMLSTAFAGALYTATASVPLDEFVRSKLKK